MTELVAHPSVGRTYAAGRRVRLGDADPTGRIRLDAIARYLQDVSDDDTRDSGFDEPMSWVVRRTAIEVGPWPEVGEDVVLRTFCGGIGPRWAERRVSMSGSAGGCVEAATLWVHLDLDTMAPKRLSDSFLACFAEAAGGRTVRARLHHGPPPAGAVRRAWTVRATDLDLLDHVNNAAMWAIVEEVLAERADLRRRALAAELEFPLPLAVTDDVELAIEDRPEGFGAWVVGRTTAAVHAAAVVRTL